MKNQHRVIFFSLTLILALSIGQPATAQTLPNMAGTCSGEIGPIDITGGTATSGTLNPGANGINTGACGGNNNLAGSDGVICFTPEFSCTLDLICKGGPATRHAKVSIGVCGDMTMCSTESDTDITISAVLGTHYCLYCEHVGAGLVGYTINESVDCGLLPVELESFSIRSSDDESAEDSE